MRLACHVHNGTGVYFWRLGLEEFSTLGIFGGVDLGRVVLFLEPDQIELYKLNSNFIQAQVKNKCNHSNAPRIIDEPYQRSYLGVAMRSER